MLRCIALMLAFSTAGAFRYSPAGDLADIKARGVLRVLVVQTDKSPEFFSLQSGQAPGFDREILDSFARTQGVRLEPVVVAGWDQLIPALQAGKGDVIAGRFTVTEARRQQVAFTVDVFPTRPVVLTRKPRKPVETLAELRALRVGAVKGSSMAETLAGLGVPARNVDTSIPPGGSQDALIAGKVDAVVLGVESALVAVRDDAAFEIGLFLGEPSGLAYAVRREDTQLLNALNQQVRSMVNSTAWSQLVLKYFGATAPEILRRTRK